MLIILIRLYNLTYKKIIRLFQKVKEIVISYNLITI